ncbi:LuxR C-terminal-related transcriptional regulator [Pseudomonas sp. SWRI100]|uniref:helix-turn-helix transcriptional regulator n=1 Tax=Pseudomonas TaxID=286 RepID=UPI001644C233|nr:MULTISPECIES: LuxR C-terminal-related transcriptional regulator [Pseudomonas]MBC3484802.1 LuxR family transcriptional regulator [Pseudomonas sp. SWRI50]MBC3495240.1 LuxR family transcriptional regulator [Pseudomonas sp. SWRI67]MBV4526998.1 LuxR C-terminal-related transcriptional regulator [Pseudomonas kermanshahensis]
MNSHLLYPQIGKVIASTGSRQFPRMLHDLIQAHLTIDATHIRLLPVAPAGPEANAPVINETVFSSDVQPSRDCSDPSRLHLIRRKGDARYEIQVLRADSAYGFSAFERNRLDDISPLLLPMLEKHIDALQPAAERATQESLEQRFLDRLAQSGLKLSERERQVCLGLLAGHTAPEQAERLELKVNTVESYLRRAAIKLGISGRHSLMRWMYTAV